jgi:8-amino-7-oxononanoate synthase
MFNPGFNTQAVRASQQLKADLALKLQARREQNLLRQILQRQNACQPDSVFENEQQLINFCSNDYLGLASHSNVIHAMQTAAQHYGVGSGASHLVTGHCRVHDELAESLADFCGREKAMLFSTGYMANLGVINALADAGTPVIQDQLNHASLLDGGWLSKGVNQRYLHADVRDLESRLGLLASDVRPLLVTDGVFSMDGDLAPLPELVVLADKYQATLIVDDAHGVGCLGDGGSGTLSHFGLGADDVPVLVGTMGKSLGTAGAFVAGDAVLIDYLTQFARTHIYTTAMPPPLAAATLAALECLRSQPWRQQRLKTLVGQFQRDVAELGLNILPSQTPVQAIVLGEAARAVKASEFLRDRGVQVSAIRPPTVPAGSARLRLTFSALHTNEHYARLMTALDALASEMKNRPEAW